MEARMVRPRKAEQAKDLQKAIKETAWKLIAAEGAAALSLRAIARELEITAPAIYNYFPRRDDLVTALIVDAFTEFGDAQIHAVEAVEASDHAMRLRGLGWAYRQWALEHPERFQLIFGTPLPGYSAPAPITLPAAERGLSALIGVLAGAQASGLLKTDHLPPMSADLQAMCAHWQEEREAVDSEVIYFALTIWSAVQGLVSLEIGNQFPAYIRDAGPLYERFIEMMVAQTIGP
jgi:AcrR family transcriptional regulator